MLRTGHKVDWFSVVLIMLIFLYLEVTFAALVSLAIIHRETKQASGQLHPAETIVQSPPNHTKRHMNA